MRLGLFGAIFIIYIYKIYTLPFKWYRWYRGTGNAKNRVNLIFNGTGSVPVGTGKFLFNYS